MDKFEELNHVFFFFIWNKKFRNIFCYFYSLIKWSHFASESSCRLESSAIRLIFRKIVTFQQSVSAEIRSIRISSFFSYKLSFLPKISAELIQHPSPYMTSYNITDIRSTDPTVQCEFSSGCNLNHNECKDNKVVSFYPVKAVAVQHRFS